MSTYAKFLKHHLEYFIIIMSISFPAQALKDFLKRDNNKLISQPIKGTIKRGINTTEDILLKNKLSNDEKEKTENVMIVDLVRNDLAKISKKTQSKLRNYATFILSKRYIK